MLHARITGLTALLLLPEMGEAQTSPLALPDPPSLAPPPIVAHLVFEQPAYLMGLFMLAGIVSYFSCASRGNAKRGMSLAACAVALALASYLIAHFVRTDRERIIANAAELVHATAMGNSQRVDELMFDSVQLHGLSEGEMERGQILTHVRDDFAPGGRYRIQEHAILEIDAQITGKNTGVSQLKVRATPSAAGFPVFSWWRLSFQHDDAVGDWKAVALEPLSATIPGIVRDH